MDYIKEINNLLETNIDRNKVQPILDFTLLWNLFELKFCNKKCKTNEISKLVGNIHINNEEKIDNIFNYFRDRYIKYDKTNSKFDKLNFKFIGSDSLKENITYNLIHSKNKLETILHIIYRFRNNLFHWEKGVSFINYQIENFNYANNFLYLILEYKINPKW